MRTIARRVHAAFTAGPATTRLDTYIALVTAAAAAFALAWPLSLVLLA